MGLSVPWFDKPVPTPDYAALRVGYTSQPLRQADMAPDPLTHFQAWFADALAAELLEPNAMTLATVDAAGHPAARTVLLKGVDHRGFQFASNYASAKGQQIDANSAVALVMVWLPLSRQVCVRGRAQRASREESQAYFASRPRGHQLGAWASTQSQVIAGREELLAAYAEAEQRFPDEVPTPEHWGLYTVIPDTIEFWQGQQSRLHDRLRYRRLAQTGMDDASAWVLERLAP